MPLDKQKIDHLLMNIASIIDHGGMLQICDMERNVISLPVVIDELVLSKIGQVGDRPDFWMAWRPMGLTAKYESGAFNVEEPEFGHIVDFSIEEDSIYFTREHPEGGKDILVVTPLSDEYRGEWEEWNRFKREHRDHFGDIDLYLAHLLEEKSSKAIN